MILLFCKVYASNFAICAKKFAKKFVGKLSKIY